MVRGKIISSELIRLTALGAVILFASVVTRNASADFSDCAITNAEIKIRQMIEASKSLASLPDAPKTADGKPYLQYPMDAINTGVQETNGKNFCTTWYDSDGVNYKPGTHEGWTAGFSAGTIWQACRLTGNKTLGTLAEEWTAPISTNDIMVDGLPTFNAGYIDWTSHGQELKALENRQCGLESNPAKVEEETKILIESAAGMAQRYNPSVGHGTLKTQFQPVGIHLGDYQADPKQVVPDIVDVVPNLELMMWAARYVKSHLPDEPAIRQSVRELKDMGNSVPLTSMYTMAIHHTLTAIDNHIRPDGGTCQLVEYVPNGNGSGYKAYCEPRQGYSKDSTWSRGQAWMIYGLPMMLNMIRDDNSREFTKAREKILASAEQVSNYYIEHAPADGIPYWDFNAPTGPMCTPEQIGNRPCTNMNPNEGSPLSTNAVVCRPKDSSAAAIAADGMLELSQNFPNGSKLNTRYFRYAVKILANLSEKYMNKPDGQALILNHCTYTVPNIEGNKPSGIDAGCVWGDYYFLDSLARYRKILGPKRKLGCSSSTADKESPGNTSHSSPRNLPSHRTPTR